MVQHTPHARLLSEAGRNVLGPLGMERLGRTRLWIDDCRWYLGLVEFEPDGIERGSHLRVGAMWLWSGRDEFHIDFGKRLEKFVPFRNKSQFEREAARLAQRAAEAIIRQRARFVTLSDLADALYTEARSTAATGTMFDAAVVCALAGRSDAARMLFARISADPPVTPRQRHLCEQAALLLKDLDSPPLFRTAVEQRIAEARRTLRLQKIDGSILPDSPAPPADPADLDEIAEH